MFYPHIFYQLAELTTVRELAEKTTTELSYHQADKTLVFRKKKMTNASLDHLIFVPMHIAYTIHNDYINNNRWLFINNDNNKRSRKTKIPPRYFGRGVVE